MCEKDIEELLDFLVTETHTVTKEDRSGLGYRANVTVEQFSLGSLNNQTITAGTCGLMVFEVRYPGTWLQDDIFLKMLLDLVGRQ